MTLEKAKLIKFDGNGSDIQLMFNPTEISFARTSNWKSDPGNRGDSLLPKVNFSGVEPYSLTLSNIMFDTYDNRESVLKKYIENIKKSVTAPDGFGGRPPVYIFQWGSNTYFHCVITKLAYRLTMFLADGTPVRAIVDLSIQEVDAKNLPGGRKSESGNERKKDTIEARKKKK